MKEGKIYIIFTAVSSHRVSISGTLTSPEKKKLPLEKLILQSEILRALNWRDGNIKCHCFKASSLWRVLNT